ncbi:MAG: hypothetical protein ABEN55_11685, partial [Bradymonadaceae bacterium]
RLDEEMYASAVETWEVEADEEVLEGLRDAVAHLHLVGVETLEPLTPAQGARLLALAAKYARDLPGLDVTEPFWVDVSSLIAAEEGADDAPLRRRALEEVLGQQSIADAFAGNWEPESADAAGLVGTVDAGADRPVLRLELDLDAESLALVAMLDDSSDDSTDQTTGRLRKELRKKVRDQMEESPQHEQSGPDEDYDNTTAA